ncbi:hypothetical protein GDO81_018372 [Engystomops pustulosus]|uniref:SEFIR domain-containing protein n=1 Tax=Engystomops pustulosus TaxID=76066 RepID=A0AAV7ABE6_ENGPU|nr:hypothetical protein GDO81_018372 [Engystomops pustulosus]
MGLPAVQSSGMAAAGVSASARTVRLQRLLEHGLVSRRAFRLFGTSGKKACWEKTRCVSTVSLRIGPTCKLCLRINISVNATELPKFRGFVVWGLELSENRFHSFQILKKKHVTIKDLWEVTYDCWVVTPGQYISVTLLTVPNHSFTLNKSIFIPNRDAKPDFQYNHIADEKRFEISVPTGPDVYVRLCHEAIVCEDLEGRNTTRMNSSQNASLSYEHLVPCLCIEAYYTDPDSRRNKECPFKEHPERYIKQLLEASVKNVSYHHPSRMMSVEFDSPCLFVPTVRICRKQNGRCITDEKAKVTEYDKVYYLKSVDLDHHLCFEFTSQNHTHIKCPQKKDRAWGVDMEIRLYDAQLTILSNVSASFAAVVCRPNQKTGDCDHQSVINEVSTKHPSGSKDLRVLIPRPRTGECIKFWRSDVSFSHEYLLCPSKYSHKHLGLLSLVTSLGIIALILTTYAIYRRIWKIFTAPLWRRTILLVYSPDSAEHKTLICAFADFLHNILGCEVILDQWDMNTVSQIGTLPWFYQKRELVSQQKGKVMIVWTRRSKKMYDQWRNRENNNIGCKDSTNLFGAAMSCLEKDFEVPQRHGIVEDYTMVCFEGLCRKKDIPKRLRKISRYRLFKDLYRLVSHLQDTTCLSPPCLLKAVAKYLMKKLTYSEKKKSLQHHIELCKQKLVEDVR